MEQVRLEVRHRSVLLDRRDYVFITEDGVEIEKISTEGVVKRVSRYVNRKMRGVARVHGRAQLLHALRQFNSPREGYTQFVVVEAPMVELLTRLDGLRREYALDDGGHPASAKTNATVQPSRAAPFFVSTPPNA